MNKATGSKKRMPFDEYFMRIAFLAGERSTCLRRKVGAVLVKGKQIIATGYNGPPMGTLHCEEKGGCLREQMKIPSGHRFEMCRASHAEENAIAQAARVGVSVDGSTIYVKNFPCLMCVRIMINAGIREIVFANDYGDSDSTRIAKELLTEAGIKVRRLDLKSG